MIFIFFSKILRCELCTVCEAVGHAKRYYGGQTKSHKCQFGGTNDRTRILIYCIQHVEHFLELMPVVEKPEIVKAKKQTLTSLGKKYLVNVISCVLLLKKTLLGKSDLKNKKLMDWMTLFFREHFTDFPN